MRCGRDGLNILGECNGRAQPWAQWRTHILYGILGAEYRVASAKVGEVLQRCLSFSVRSASHWVNYSRKSADKYVLFDCPGQIELYTHHHCMRNICERLQEQWDYRVREPDVRHL